ncbi:DUF927 domain-containing protein [Metallibacterium scheffleri]|jgi:putative DNA primase/helicase|uniref:DUF927 domain-containing protein n=1 Tax=Metallibacterium scheffleri TaxID=993689 RepID=UPI0026F1A426|nr:DUF927 domain-containing protein [Metallibacterium scheffleri]MBW8075202.1 DUF927 domain-containing protein [Metallibacterium scheffleri]
MTAPLDAQAERDLARMQAARAAKTNGKQGKAGRPASAGGARFVNTTSEVMGRPGVYWIGTAQDRSSGETIDAEPLWICSLLTVAALTRDASGSEWGRLLVFADRDGQEHRWARPMSMLAGSGEELRAELLRQGLEVTTLATRRGKLAEYIGQARPEAKARCVLRTGWHDGVFVLPTCTYGEHPGEPVIFQGATVDGVALAVAGTLDGWRAQVAAPCIGNSRLVLALSAAFAAPCLGLLDSEGGGFHLRGSSSSGKSTALAVAASVCGPAAYVRTWRATDNALEAVASLYSDLLLPLDEISQLDPRNAGAAAYLLANGQGKSRSHRDGSARAAARFRSLFLSAGEVGLGDLVTASGSKSRAGHEVRVIDVPADVEGGCGLFERLPDGCAPGDFADRMRRAAAEHHGHALREWLAALTADSAGARDTLRAHRDRMAEALCDPAAVGQVRRVAQRFALAAAAGELATCKGLTGWPQGEAGRAAQSCFAAWLRARGTDGAAEPAAMLAQVRLFLAQHGESRFSPWRDADESHKPRTINRAGFRKGKDDGGGLAYYVEAEVFRGDVCAGFDPRQVARTLALHGALRLDGDGGFTRRERLPDGRKARVYVILPELWGDDGDGEAGE